MRNKNKVVVLVLCVVSLVLYSCGHRPGTNIWGITDFKELHTATLQNMETVIPKLKKEHYQQCINLVKKDGDGSFFSGSPEVIYKPTPSKALSCLNLPIRPYQGQSKFKAATFAVVYHAKNSTRKYLASCVFRVQNDTISVRLGPTSVHRSEPCFAFHQTIPTTKKLISAYQKSRKIVNSLEY